MKLCLIAGVVLMAASGHAAGVGTTPVTAASRLESPRGEAVGGGAAALGLDPTLVWTNPAAAASLVAPSITAGAHQGAFGDRTGHAFATLPNRGRGISVGVHYFDAGRVDLLTTSGVPWSSRVRQDVLLTGGYALPLGEGMAVGLGAKFLQSRLFEAFTALAVGADAGLLVPLAEHCRAGVAVLNLFSGLQQGEQRLSLPTVVRGGLAAIWPVGARAGRRAADTLTLVADADWRIIQGGAAIHAGIEYTWRGLLALRAGGTMSTDTQINRFSAGVGVHLRGLRLDYAVRLGGEADLPQMMSLTVEFGPRRSAAADAGQPDPAPDQQRGEDVPQAGPLGQ